MSGFGCFEARVIERHHASPLNPNIWRCRGEWDGMEKSGLGTYKYPSTARYEGEWKHNLKDGCGIYYYPKGGLYKVIDCQRTSFITCWEERGI